MLSAAHAVHSSKRCHGASSNSTHHLPSPPPPPAPPSLSPQQQLQKYRLKEQKRQEEETEAVGRSFASLTAALAATGSRCPARGCAGSGAGAVPPVAAALHASPNVPSLTPGMVPMNAIGSGELVKLWGSGESKGA